MSDQTSTEESGPIRVVKPIIKRVHVDAISKLALNVTPSGIPILVITDHSTGNTAEIAIDAEWGPRLASLVLAAADIADGADE